MTPGRRNLLLAAGGGVALAGVAWLGLGWWSFHQTHVSTDDAYVRANIAQVTARVPGTLLELAVDDNDHVEEGDLIAKLDRSQSELRLADAKEQVLRSIRLVEEMKGAILAAEGRLRVLESEQVQHRIDHGRAEKLAVTEAISKEELDRARTDLATGDAKIEMQRREVARAKAALGIPVDAPTENTAIVRQAVAARDLAQLLVSYTEIRAPIRGVVTKRGVEIGQQIKEGQPLMMIVPLDRVYVEANFKETELASVRVGQPVEIAADVYPGVLYRGHVESVAPGAGSAFALLPPENATGNWVKVVQRVPVRIALDAPPPADRPLRVSLSVVATIDVSEAGAVVAARPPAEAALHDRR